MDSILTFLQSSQLPQYAQLGLLFFLVFFGKGKGKDMVVNGAKKILMEALEESLVPVLKKSIKDGVREGLNPYIDSKKYNGETQTSLDEVKDNE